MFSRSKVVLTRIGIVFAIIISLACCTTDGARKVIAQESTEGTRLAQSQAAAAEPVPESQGDKALALYRDPESRPWVSAFFASVAGSEDVSRSILYWADVDSVPVALAFSLAYEESRFEPRALSRNKGSVDRGLFQLNSKSFPGLSDKEFFDPWDNSRFGIDHLRFCLAEAGNEVAALAIYNAGSGRVKGDGTPRVTLDYISRILDTRSKIDRALKSRADAAKGSGLRKMVKIAYFSPNPLTRIERMDILSLSTR
jgi:soluble lytic murein transglycosylase-like protein